MHCTETLYAKHRRVRSVEEISPSRIKYSDITAVISGEMEYAVNGKTELLSAGDMIFISAGKVRSRSAGNTPAEYVSLNFVSDEPIELPEVIHGALSSEVMLQLALIEEVGKKFYPTAEPMISPLIECLIMTMQRKLENETLPPLVRSIVDYIHANLSSKITLKDIGEHTFFNPIYCDTVFKNTMGRSILDYTIEKRIDEAKKLILHDTRSLSKIAESVGFTDYNYFARTFKKRSGYTPLEYKKIFTS